MSIAEEAIALEKLEGDQEIQKLFDIAQKKSMAAVEIELTVHKRRSELEAKYDAIVRQEIEKEFGSSLQNAQRERNEANTAWEQAVHAKKIREALKTLPFPEGTILVKWEQSRYGSGWLKTKVQAVFEIFRNGDPIPDNIRWSRWYPGDFVVRYLKKDGTKGSRLDRYGMNCGFQWLPEGQEPTVKT